MAHHEKLASRTELLGTPVGTPKPLYNDTILPSLLFFFPLPFSAV